MSLVLAAPAKLNLGLEVLGRRADGYHVLRSLMVTISLADSVEVVPGPGLEVSGPYAAGVPTDRSANLASRALAELEAIGARGGHGLRLAKNIPPGGGLAGGSADAAAVLRAAPKLGVDAGRRQLAEIAARLGADVPYQLAGGLATVGGVGERVERYPDIPMWFAVAYDGTVSSTAAVFAELQQEEWTEGTAIDGVEQLLQFVPVDLPAEAAAVVPLLDGLSNSLAPAAMRVYPQLKDAKERLAAVWDRPKLTGAGASFFQRCSDENEARSLAAAATAEGFATWACHTLPAFP